MKYIVLFSSILFNVVAFGQSHAQILKQIELGFRPDFIQRDQQKWSEEIKIYQESLSGSGIWKDIDYRALKSLDFSPKTHLSRTAVMAEGYGTPGQIHYKSQPLLNRIEQALAFWIQNDFQSYNWWHNEIGTQQYILRTLVLTGNDLEPGLIQKSFRILNKTKIQQTGQNRMWRSEIVFVRSVLNGKIGEAKVAAKEIEKLLEFDKSEGIQSDGSFLQHGNLIYNGGYGDKFVLLMARYLSIVDGSAYDFSSTSKQRFIDHVLNAQLWLTRNNKYDYGVMGRSLTVKNRKALNLASACEALSRMNIMERNELQKCYLGIVENKPNGLKGHKSFYKSDFAVQQENDYFASVRMYSRRTLNNDAPSNGEGLMSHHLADGALMLQKDGTEYENIFPVWNWNQIPGTTVEQKQMTPAVYIPGREELFKHIRFFGRSEFVGSVSNGRYGASSFNFISNPNYDKLLAKKSWFFFDNAIWNLGSDIQCQDCEVVKTTLNQTKSKGEVKIFNHARQSILLEEDRTENDLFAILHQNVGYIFPVSQKVSVSNKIQQGDWATINSSLKSEPVSMKVFSATINHGVAPVAESYEYVIIPETNEKKLKTFKVDENFSYINTASIHAVFSKKQNLLQAALFEPTKMSLENLVFEVDGPCLLMVEVESGNYKVIVSDPTQEQRNVTVSINGRTYTAIYPSGMLAGSSVQAF